jgi:hypothetical protein
LARPRGSCIAHGLLVAPDFSTDMTGVATRKIYTIVRFTGYAVVRILRQEIHYLALYAPDLETITQLSSIAGVA